MRGENGVDSVGEMRCSTDRKGKKPSKGAGLLHLPVAPPLARLSVHRLELRVFCLLDVKVLDQVGDVVVVIVVGLFVRMAALVLL